METIFSLLPYVGTLGAFLIGLYKDRILHALNIKQKKVEVDASIIGNHEKNIQLYQVMLDDIDARYKKRINELEASFDENIAKLKAINAELSEIIKSQGSELRKYKVLHGTLPPDEENE